MMGSQVPFGMRGVLIAMAIATSLDLPAHAWPRLLPKPDSLLNKARRLGAISLGTLIIAGSGLKEATEAFHDRVATELVRKHLGLSIYFDLNSFIRALPRDLQAQIQLGQKDGFSEAAQIEIATRVSKLLEGDGQSSREGIFLLDESNTLFPFPEFAENFLNSDSKNQTPAPGVCRHRSLILRHFLNAIGIPAHLYFAKIQNLGSHVWVELASQDVVLDPANGEVSGMTRQQFIRSFANSGANVKENSIKEIRDFRSFFRLSLGANALVD